MKVKELNKRLLQDGKGKMKKRKKEETRKDKEPQMRCRQIDCSHNKVEIGTDRKTAKGREIEKTITF